MIIYDSYEIKVLMNKSKEYVRKTISISPEINKILIDGARNEFGGNLSAFLAHIALDYVKCKNCTEKTTQRKNCNNSKEK